MAMLKSYPKRKGSKKIAPQAPTVLAEERHSMIAEAAYHCAQQRALQDAVSDWLAAEKEIDKKLAKRIDVIAG